MYVFQKYRTVKSVFAVFLAVVFAFLSLTPSVYADETTEDPGDNGNPYVYAVEIEFGSFGFYYDYGTWNEDSFSYEASLSSSNPAAGTDKNEPGWYGFDGITNRIKIVNLTPDTTEGESIAAVKISLQYSDVSDYSSSFPLAQGCVSMYCYEEPELVSCLNENTPNICEFIVPNIPVGGSASSRFVYLSFSGEPRTKDGGLFISSSAQRIGYITLGVEVVSP